MRILKRDGYACRYCGAKYEEIGKAHHIDHITPVVAGGPDEDWNLVTACPSCNLKKHDSLEYDGMTQAEIGLDAGLSKAISGFAEGVGMGPDSRVRFVSETLESYARIGREFTVAALKSMADLQACTFEVWENDTNLTMSMAAACRSVESGTVNPQLVKDVNSSIAALSSELFQCRRLSPICSQLLVAGICDDIYAASGYTGWDGVPTQENLRSCLYVNHCKADEGNSDDSIQ